MVDTDRTAVGGQPAAVLPRRGWLAAIIAGAVLIELWLAYRYFGFITGDDVEVLAEAFRQARGFAYAPWNIRNLFVPDVIVAPAIAAAWKIGFRDTRSLIFAASLPFVAMMAITIGLVYRLARRWSNDDGLAALVASLLFALHWIPLGFGSTVYPRTLATACVVGAALLASKGGSPFRFLAAGALAGLAFADRFSEIVFLVPIVIACVWRYAHLRRISHKPYAMVAIENPLPAIERGEGGRRPGEGTRRGGFAPGRDGGSSWQESNAPREPTPPHPPEPALRSDRDEGAPSPPLKSAGEKAIDDTECPQFHSACEETCVPGSTRFGAILAALFIVLGAGLAIAATVGWYDYVTWGAPYSSFVKFTHLTVVDPDFASRVKYQSPLWYLANLARWCSPALLPLLWFSLRRSPRRRDAAMAWCFILIPLVAFSAVRHKELRYLQGIIPFVMIAAAIGFAALWRTGSAARRNVAVTLVAVSILWNLYGMRSFIRKSMPAVMAARALAADPTVHTVALSQLWAYGDRLYLGERMFVHDVGEPPGQRFPAAVRSSEAVALWEDDLDDPRIVALLRANGFAPAQTYRDGEAKAVVVFRRGRL